MWAPRRPAPPADVARCSASAQAAQGPGRWLSWRVTVPLCHCATSLLLSAGSHSQSTHRPNPNLRSRPGPRWRRRRAQVEAELRELGATLVTTAGEVREAIKQAGMDQPKLALDCVSGAPAAPAAPAAGASCPLVRIAGRRRAGSVPRMWGGKRGEGGCQVAKPGHAAPRR